jgi:hypothetical protein
MQALARSAIPPIATFCTLVEEVVLACHTLAGVTSAEMPLRAMPLRTAAICYATGWTREVTATDSIIRPQSWRRKDNDHDRHHEAFVGEDALLHRHTTEFFYTMISLVTRCSADDAWWIVYHSCITQTEWNTLHRNVNGWRNPFNDIIHISIPLNET